MSSSPPYLSLHTHSDAHHPGGSVTLTSSNPFAFPNIDTGFLTTAFDIFAITEAVKAAKRFMAAPAWKGYVTGRYEGTGFADANTDAEIAEYARNNAATVFHPTGTAMMSPYGANHGVTNPDLTVKNTLGLRVVDASVFVSPRPRCGFDG